MHFRCEELYASFDRLAVRASTVASAANSPSLREGRPQAGEGELICANANRTLPSPRFARPSQREGDQTRASQTTSLLGAWWSSDRESVKKFGNGRVAAMVNAQSLRWQRLPVDHLYESNYRIAGYKEVLANATVVGIMLIGGRWLLRFVARFLRTVTLLMVTTANLDLSLTLRRLSMLR